MKLKGFNIMNIFEKTINVNISLKERIQKQIQRFKDEDNASDVAMDLLYLIEEQTDMLIAMETVIKEMDAKLQGLSS